MDSFRIMLFLHVVSAIVAMGAGFVYPFLQAAAERTGVAVTRFVFRGILRVEKLIVYPGAALLFLVGVGMIFDDATGYKDDMPVWLTVAIAWYVGLVALDLFYFRRLILQALAVLDAAPEGPELPAAYAPIGRRIQMAGGLLGISVVAIAFLMVWGREGGF